MTWRETKSALRIATARNTSTGRSRTIQAVHASETAFWEDPDTLMVGLRNTMPSAHGTLFIVESTANGMGNWYHKTWTEAVLGINEFVPVFYPWFKHYEYRERIDADFRRQLIHSEDEAEQLLLRLGASPEALAWRRQAIPRLCHGSEDFFKQEYPATPTEAFLSKGRNVFPQEELDAIYKPAPFVRGYIDDTGGKYTFVPNQFGPLTIFKMPSQRRDFGKYFIGADPSRTTMGDGACMQVVNTHTFEQVAVWHGFIDPINFATELIKLGHFYNTAEMAPEIEGPGYATIGALVASGYPRIWQHRWADKHPGKISMNYGWSTNHQRKHWAIGQLLALMKDRSITVHDAITYDQLSKYVVLNDYGDMGNADQGKGFDDAVMALAITYICMITEGPNAFTSDDRPPVNSPDIMGVDPSVAWR